MTTRRSFLKGSAAIAASQLFVLPFSLADAASTAPLKINYLTIGADGSIVITSAVAEVGQGTSTALSMILADALDAEWSKVRVELAGVAPEYINPTFGMQLTGASTGISGFHDLYQAAGATARSMLIRAAAEIWKVSPESCKTSKGRVLSAHGKSIGYGDLTFSAARQPVPGKVDVSSVRKHLVGTAVPRLDIPAKIDGSAKFAIDIRLPGMLYATVAAAPVTGATLVKDQRAAIKDKKGIVAVVDVPGGVVVVADKWWRANSALEDLAPEWSSTTHDDVNDASISSQLWNDLSSKDGILAKSVGTPAQAIASAGKTLTAKYEVPFLAHGTMEPMSCVAVVHGDTCEIWAGSQRPDRARQAAAEVLGIPETAITVHAVFGGGGFGRRQEPDFVIQAVTAAKAVPGKPVKLVWSREEDIQHDAYRPAGVSELTAGISDGQLVAFRHRQASPSVLPRTFPAVFAILPYDTSVADGIVPIYSFPNQDAWWIDSETHIRTGMWRSVGASQTIFAIESFIDEIAADLGEDAFTFRRKYLEHDSRALAAWDRLGQLCQWDRTAAEGRNIGFAISHKNEDCLVAQAAEVAMVDGQVRVNHIWTVADPGRVIAPDIAKAQLEGAAIWALSAALYGKITIADGRVQEGNFDTYQVLRLAETPTFTTDFLESGAPLEGIGEGGAPGVAPAVCNALFRLTGKRIRTLPINASLS
ncbi:CO/xanthine dehydrogenase Mo-binding subunit [Rhizobium leguminosarum]|uniref:CO/xanthine dehydrogenase Mo-binding subunit n=1 Tax=Rhizobium leguminosarum TaxID=384 RepID=A0AAE2MLQ5_RHILE|nr:MULTISPECIES: molybdopterin cofactor-binding domain-containing protein [Rhizobium]MBB4291502.1 CO/xanthine dehydrogenase Mo-binding subunit [Rhizobium leguminosarum]MBB4296199.1 CO/xanthine dehydrogenase Mo-binding subunit [Rhizobium leguminosarum]MBB4308542.1 CO/xanthine dehydrogenase Mo-binding subunit [Rhizobium leguminosarum]MBB4416377.1 CO/xanthine dehydrogenase Mo-binding subunit [Rhizobium leguminosarum]MBB4430656.1 CO/xanthine dehydrogenase Mo-binding subunit [Rhizobium esperanzae]